MITPQYLTACVRDALADEDALLLTEAVTNYGSVSRAPAGGPPRLLISSGGSSLGWAGGGAIGAKLAAPDRTIVCLVGDGSYLFGVPSSAQWVGPPLPDARADGDLQQPRLAGAEVLDARRPPRGRPRPKRRLQRQLRARRRTYPGIAAGRRLTPTPPT